ncbi:MAG: Hpt domain-containing protein [Actinomycetota bacterium]
MSTVIQAEEPDAVFRPSELKETAARLAAIAERLGTGMLDPPAATAEIRTVVERLAHIGAMLTGASPGAMSDGPDQPLVDVDVLIQMVDDFAAVEPVLAIIDAFVNDADERRRAVHRGANSPRDHDRAEATRACHTLKSTAALVGARELSLAAKALESCFRSGSRPETADVVSLDRLLAKSGAALLAARRDLTSEPAPPPRAI